MDVNLSMYISCMQTKRRRDRFLKIINGPLHLYRLVCGGCFFYANRMGHRTDSEKSDETKRRMEWNRRGAAFNLCRRHKYFIEK